MSIIEVFKKSSKEFYKQCFNYLMLFFSMSIMLYAIGAILNYVAAKVLHSNNIPYLSYTNISILIEKPVVLFVLIILFLLLIIMVFFQFSYLLLGIKQIRERHFNIGPLLKESWSNIFKHSFRTYFFFIFYFILILPFAKEIFSTPLLNKVVIPTFIIEFIAKNTLYALVLMVLALVVTYIAIRWIFILPLVILKGKSSKEAIKESLSLTKKRFWYYIWRIIVFSFLSIGIKFVLCFLLYYLQVGLDTLDNSISLVGGIINLSLIQIIEFIGGTWSVVILIYLLLYEANITFEIKQESSREQKASRLLFKVNTTILIGTGLLCLLFNALYLNGLVQETPKVISHRGVDSLSNPNGVQNTIPSLINTSKLKPDYIEIDIQETKDNQFVMMHDPDIYNLTGHHGSPQDYTLKELTKMKASENDMSAQVVSFDEYLNKANKLKQKLFIEIKTSKNDTNKLMDNFIKRYQKDIIKNKHVVQSLDYDVIKTIKKVQPKIETFYILPYNFIYPDITTNGFTMEETTLNDSFIIKSALLNHKVYAWTPNTVEAMDKLMFMGVDGIISDEVSMLQEEIAIFQKSPNYADRIMNYISIMPS